MQYSVFALPRPSRENKFWSLGSKSIPRVPPSVLQFVIESPQWLTRDLCCGSASNIRRCSVMHINTRSPPHSVAVALSAGKLKLLGLSRTDISHCESRAVGTQRCTLHDMMYRQETGRHNGISIHTAKAHRRNHPQCENGKRTNICFDTNVMEGYSRQTEQ